MSYQISPHLDHAKRLIEAGDEHSLVYAALELRLGLEVVCYEKLRLRLEYVSPEDIADWRPNHVLRALQDFVDPHIFEPAILHVKQQSIQEDLKAWLQVCERKGMTPRRWSEIWNKLGRYLHVHKPNSHDAPVRAYPDADALKKILLDVIKELEPLASGGDINFSGPMTYCHCTSCGVRVRRPDATLRPGQVITCMNPSCLKEWIVEKDEAGRLGFASNVVEISCRRCERQTFVPQKIFREMKFEDLRGFTCGECGARNLVRLGFECALAEEGDPARAPQNQR